MAFTNKTNDVGSAFAVSAVYDPVYFRRFINEGVCFINNDGAATAANTTNDADTTNATTTSYITGSTINNFNFSLR